MNKQWEIDKRTVFDPSRPSPLSRLFASKVPFLVIAKNTCITPWIFTQPKTFRNLFLLSNRHVGEFSNFSVLHSVKSAMSTKTTFPTPNPTRRDIMFKRVSTPGRIYSNTSCLEGVKKINPMKTAVMNVAIMFLLEICFQPLQRNTLEKSHAAQHYDQSSISSSAMHWRLHRISS